MRLDLRPLLAGERLLEIDYELILDTDPEDTASILYGVGFPSPMKVKGDITNTAGYMRMHNEMFTSPTPGREETIIEEIYLSFLYSPCHLPSRTHFTYPFLRKNSTISK